LIISCGNALTIMSDGILAQFGLGTAALVIFALCAAYIFLRGIARMIAAVLMLCGSAWIGFQVWQRASGWAITWSGEPTPWITTGLPVLAFVGSFLVFRKVVAFVMNPFGPSRNAAPRSWGTRLALMMVAIAPTAVFFLTGATFVHHIGSIAELKAFAENSENSADESSRTALLRELKDAVAKAIPESWLKRLDPLTDPDRMAVAKWILSRRAEAPAEIDPKSGEPAPKASAVDESKLDELARDGRITTLLHHPELESADHRPGSHTRIRPAHRR
jgi:hypothetical protein